jgi:hypothetical protein
MQRNHSLTRWLSSLDLEDPQQYVQAFTEYGRPAHISVCVVCVVSCDHAAAVVVLAASDWVK